MSNFPRLFLARGGKKGKKYFIWRFFSSLLRQSLVIKFLLLLHFPLSIFLCWTKQIQQKSTKTVFSIKPYFSKPKKIAKKFQPTWVLWEVPKELNTHHRYINLCGSNEELVACGRDTNDNMQWNFYRMWHRSVPGASALQHQREGGYGMELTSPRSQLLTALCSSAWKAECGLLPMRGFWPGGSKIHGHRSFSTLTETLPGTKLSLIN